MSITANYQRLGSIVITELIRKLNTPLYQNLYIKVLKEFQSNHPSKLFFQSGRPKVQDTFPCVGLEMTQRRDEWGATSHTKDIELRLELFIAVKVLVGQKSTGSEESVDISQSEHYIIALSELIFEILNEPLTLQYTITKDQDDKKLHTPLQVYDSLAEGIDYGFLYNGSLRIGKIPWFGKIMRLGPSGGSGFFNPPA